MRDSHGRAQFSVFQLTLLEDAPDEAQEWFDNWQHPSRRYTHAVYAPEYGYPGSPIAGRSFMPERFADLMRVVLEKGISPIIWLTNVPQEFDYAINVVKALKARGLLPYVICCPACEPIPTHYYSSKQLSDLLIAMKREGGDEIVIGSHLQPGRWSMSSHPLEADDPWKGDEQGCWKSHGGEHVQVFLYQLEHGFTQTSAPDWQNRWRDGVPRMGINAHGDGATNGWREMPVCLFETVLYDSYRGACDEARAREIAAEARDIAKHEFGVSISYGNGAPRD